VSDRIRVLLVITRLELGGAQRVVLHTARNLDRERFAVALAWGPGDLLDDEAAAIADLDHYPVDSLVRNIAPISDFRALASLRAAIRSFRPTVVHTHSSKAGILGRLAARLERVPAVVHTVHGFGFTPLQPAPVRMAFRAAEGLLARWTDHFVTVSETDRQRGIEIGLFPPERATVIRAGIDLEKYRAVADGDATRERLGVPVDSPLVAQIGNFKAQKAPLDFVRVAAAVRKKIPERSLARCCRSDDFLWLVGRHTGVVGGDNGVGSDLAPRRFAVFGCRVVGRGSTGSGDRCRRHGGGGTLRRQRVPGAGRGRARPRRRRVHDRGRCRDPRAFFHGSERRARGL